MILQKGMKVRLSDNIKQSISKLGGDSSIQSMAGKVHEVVDFSSKDVCLKEPRFGGWWFLQQDIVSPSDIKKRAKIKPALFDPNNLDV